MTWPISVFWGDPDDLSDETRFRALDLERARRVLEAEDEAEDFGRQVVIGRDATYTDIALIVDEQGTLRALESEIYWDIAPPAAVRDELRTLLELFFRLADDLGARVFDHDTQTFVARSDLEALVDRYVPSAA